MTATAETAHRRSPWTNDALAAAHPIARFEARGPFLFRGGEKFTAKGVTYGPFRPNESGEFFPEPDRARKDLALMRELGFNSARLYYPPPRWFADLAAEMGISLLTGIPWPDHICGLGEPGFERKVRAGVTEAVSSLRGHPAVLGFLVGNEIPTMNVRWQGRRVVERFLGELYDVAKDADPEALISYASYPPTEYLSLERFDLYTMNVYLHKRDAFRSYLGHMRNLAGHKPFLLGEFGVDAIREGEAAQAEILKASHEEASRSGVAGTFVFSFTDEWYRGGAEVQGWAFGLTDRERRPRPAAAAVAACLRGARETGMDEEAPRASVVVATYNGAATLGETLDTLGTLDYPDYEVIIIDDGSTDRSAEIAREFVSRDARRYRLIQQENRGLSAARNRGIDEATGAIVAFCDSDVAVDPQWLRYLAGALGREGGGIAGAGGPNLPPPGDGRIAAAVSASPGGPTHVLLDDFTAEHIPGCNMAFWKSALGEVSGFDPRFHAAGDDVDICWRLQDRGLKLAFAPSAIVWHHRRNSSRAYLRQQRGYGEAEAELAAKHPGRYNAFGGALWQGRIYAASPAEGPLLRRPRIHYGVFGLGLFQTIYQPDEPFLVGLATTPEWTVLGAVAIAAGLLLGALGLAAFGALVLAAPLYSALRRATLAKIEPRYRGARTRALIFALSLAQPWVRRVAQLRTARRLRRQVETIEDLRATWFGGGGEEVGAFWTENGGERESFLRALETALSADRFPVHRGTGYEPFDLEVSGDAGARALVASVMEYHGGPRRLLRIRVQPALSRGAAAALGFSCAVAVALSSFSWAACAAAGFATLLSLVHFRRRGRWVRGAIEGRIASVARRLGFTPVPAAPHPPGWLRKIPSLLVALLA